MRDSLRPLDGKHRNFTATYENTSVRMVDAPWFGNRVLLTDLRDQAGNALTDQLSVTESAAFLGLRIQPGARLRFSARVMPHYTPNRDEPDFRLVDLRRLSIVSGEEPAP
jgi:hypothetical protein